MLLPQLPLNSCSVWIAVAIAVIALCLGYRWQRQSGKSSSKSIYCVEIPGIEENVPKAYVLEFDRIGGRPAGPAGVESIAMLADFAPFTSCKEISTYTSLLVDNPNLIVYTFFEKGDAVVLVEPAPLKLSQNLDIPRTFHYQQLRGTAYERVYLLSVTAFHLAVKEVSRTAPNSDNILDRCVFVHSTGRCGSTLLSKALGSAYGIESLSEPDIYSAVFLAFHEQRVKKPVAQQVVRDATILFALQSLQKEKTSALAIKLRSWVTLEPSLIMEAVKESKSMFLYRHPVPTIDSFCMAFFNNPFSRALRAWNLDAAFIRWTWLLDFFRMICPIMSLGKVTEEEVLQLGLVGMTAAAWMSVMEVAFAIQLKEGWDVILRYEDLVKHKENAITATVRYLFPHLITNKNQLHLGALDHVFGEDAHGSSSVTSSSRVDLDDLTHDPLYIRRDDIQPLLALLEKVSLPDVTTFILPGTIDVLQVPSFEEKEK